MKITKTQLREMIRGELKSLSEDLSAEMGPDTLSDDIYKSIKKYAGKKFSVVLDTDKTTIYIYFKKGIKKMVDPVSVGGAVLIEANENNTVEVYGDDGHSMNLSSKRFSSKDVNKINAHIKKLAFTMWR